MMMPAQRPAQADHLSSADGDFAAPAAGAHAQAATTRQAGQQLDDGLAVREKQRGAELRYVMGGTRRSADRKLDRAAYGVELDPEIPEHLGGHTLPFADQAQPKNPDELGRAARLRSPKSCPRWGQVTARQPAGDAAC
jgi:hypothetical protein